MKLSINWTQEVSPTFSLAIAGMLTGCDTNSCCRTSLLLKVMISALMSDLSDHPRFIAELFTKLHISDRKAADFWAARGGFLSWGAFESPHRRDDTRERPRLLLTRHSDFCADEMNEGENVRLITLFCCKWALSCQSMQVALSPAAAGLSRPFKAWF